MSKKTELIAQLDQMEAERQSLLTSLAGFSEETLSKKPSAEAWSVAEVILHLAVAEEGSLNYLRLKLEHGGHEKSKPKAIFKLALLNLAVALPFKFKAPKVAQIQEGSEISYSQAVAKWKTVRDAMRWEYMGLNDSIIENELFKHPSAGKFNLIQGVKFMRNHVKRHVKQIHRTSKQVS